MLAFAVLFVLLLSLLLFHYALVNAIHIDLVVKDNMAISQSDCDGIGGSTFVFLFNGIVAALQKQFHAAIILK